MSLSAVLLVFAVLVFLINKGLISMNHPSGKKYPVKGIDISHHQKNIDWTELKKNNLKFVFIKATEGTDFTDHKYEEYVRNVSELGIAAGAYHFFSLKTSGKMQAENFIRVVNEKDISLPPVIDLEFGGNSSYRPSVEEFEKELNDYISVLNAHFRKKPLLYVTYEFYDYYMSSIKINSEYSIWIRNVFYEPGNADGIDWTFWQYNSRGMVDGIEGPVDLNVYRYDEESFYRLIK
ncbi:MAG: lysozyme [Spirochaetes bacterium]|nr:lysozyme [Spirochaetota bacterium]